MVVDLIFVKILGKRRSVQIDVRYEFLFLLVPQVLSDILGQLILYLSPFALVTFVGCHFQEIIYGKHQHGIIIDINGIMRILINFYSPDMFRLDISPIGCCCSCDQAVFLVMFHQVS